MVDQKQNILLTAEEVAERLRLKPASVYAAAYAGRIPMVRLWQGRRRSLIRFLESDIEKLISTGATFSGAREDPGDFLEDPSGETAS